MRVTLVDPFDEEEPLKIAIWGAGAVGLGLAATLARPGERLLVVGRDATTLAAIEREGLLRTGRFGRHQAPPAQLAVARDPEALVAFAPDWLLVCTKAFASPDVAAALEPLAPRLPSTTRLVLCQNGWGNEAPFLAFWPNARLFHARVITGFLRRGLRAVEVTAHAAPIAFGHLEELGVESLGPLAERVAAGGLPAETTRDMRGVLWAKMLYNVALNPLGALLGRPYGALTRRPETRRIVEAVIFEIFDVLDASGIQLPWPDADAYRTYFHAELIPPTAAHESSMLQDLRAGRRTEIEALAGAVERLAVEHGVATPVVSALATLVRAAEA